MKVKEIKEKARKKTARLVKEYKSTFSAEGFSKNGLAVKRAHIKRDVCTLELITEVAELADENGIICDDDSLLAIKRLMD